MNESDTISVVIFLLLLAVAVAYALMALYAEVVLSELTCKKCGKVLSTDEAFDEHKKEHIVKRPVKLPVFVLPNGHKNAA